MIALCTVTLAAGGCSLAFVQGPPPVSERGPNFYCTTTPAAPVVDLALSLLSYLPVLGTITNSDEVYSYQHTTRWAVAAGGLTLGTVAAVSALVGLERISDCDRAKAQVANEPVPTLRVERRHPVAAPPEDPPLAAPSSPSL